MVYLYCTTGLDILGLVDCPVVMNMFIWKLPGVVLFVQSTSPVFLYLFISAEIDVLPEIYIDYL